MPPERNAARRTEWTRYDWLGHLQWDTDGERWWIIDLETGVEHAFDNGGQAVQWSFARAKERYRQLQSARN